MFLTRDKDHILAQLAIPRMGYFVNRNGNNVKGTLWLNGINECILEDTRLAESKNGNLYITCTFRRKPFQFIGLKSKTSFMVHTEYLFSFKQFSVLCGAFGHTLGEKAVSMNIDIYTRHVYNRIKTFIGRNLKVVYVNYKDFIKDDYGRNKKRNVFYDKQVDDFFWRGRVLSYHDIEEEVEVDYNMLCNINLNL